MKFITIFSLAVLFSLNLSPTYAQQLSDKDLKDNIIKDIDDARKIEFEGADKRISSSDSIIFALDNDISFLKKNKDIIENLRLQVKELEKKQQAINDKELSTYSHNYQTALINLAFLESDLKPLSLFQSTTSFFSTLNNIANPMAYNDYQDWYAEFKKYVDKAKIRDARLAVLSDMLSVTSDLTKEAPLTGPLVNTLFEGIGKFINTLGSGKRELKKKSEKMMGLTMVLGQYTHETKLIENEWGSIANSLEELQNLYQEYLTHNLNLTDETFENFNLKYVSETNGMVKLNYLNSLKTKAKQKVKNERDNNPNLWKETFYYEMIKVQSLKIRFGEITIRIEDNFIKYHDLIKRYENTELLRENMSDLKEKLVNLEKNFSESFLPEEYIKDANVMYRIN